MAGISLVSVNIERSKHLDLVVPFLRSRNADVVCLQEVMEYDIALLERELHAKSEYVGSTIHPAEERPGAVGIAIFSRLPMSTPTIEYYFGKPGTLSVFDATDEKTKHDTQVYAVLYSDIEKEGVTYRIATTHFTWTPNGDADDFQRADLAKMFPILERAGEFVFCGDMNAPRGREIFNAIASRYKDNIPSHYTSSIDPMHRAGELPYMVDGLFTTPEYHASDVALHSGVSDHKAVTATITKV